MKKSVANKWVIALRSGKFTQGQGRLCTNGKHCCLGVLCEIAPKTLGIERGIDDKGRTTFDTVAWDLPIKVQEWADIKQRDGSFYKDGKNKSLQYMNDDLLLSFNQIADYIEKNYKDI